MKSGQHIRFDIPSARRIDGIMDHFTKKIDELVQRVRVVLNSRERLEQDLLTLQSSINTLKERLYELESLRHYNSSVLEGLRFNENVLKQLIAMQKDKEETEISEDGTFTWKLANVQEHLRQF